jgi:hypothetical protein
MGILYHPIYINNYEFTLLVRSYLKNSSLRPEAPLLRDDMSNLMRLGYASRASIWF